MTRDPYFQHPRPEMLRYCPSSAVRILDVGCGAGVFGQGLKRTTGAEVWGIELDATAAAAAAAVLDRVLVGDAAARVAELAGERFDVVYCNDILEHLVDPEALLRDLRPLIGPAGVLIASIPNVRHFPNVRDLALRGRWDYVDEGILDRTHLRFFTRSSIAAMFARCGYGLRRIEGIHPTRSVAFRLFNLATLGRFAEMRWLQFACVASPAD